MPFETLKKSHVKKNIIIGVLAVALIIALVLQFTRAKYSVAQSMPLINGTVNYTLADLSIVAMYIDGVETDSLDSTKEYTLDTTQSTCTYKDGTNIEGLKIDYDTETKSLTITPYTTKGTKCVLYFDEIKDTTRPVINSVQNSVTKTSITVTVSASDDTGVTGYYYRLGTSGDYNSSTSNSYTFSGLTSGTKYTVNIYAVDAAGNESSVYSASIETENDYCPSGASACETIMANVTLKTDTPDFSKTSCSSGCGEATVGLYSAEDDDGTTYYFRGDVNNNYVYFAGFYWRIIRINGDGTIRLIYQGPSATSTGTSAQIGTSYFNSSFSYAEQTGYMYTIGQAHGLGTSSTVKTTIDNWYYNNLRNYANYIDTDAGFCGDRTTTSGTGMGETGYSAWASYTRLRNYSPSFKCTYTSDLYSVSSTKGNGALTYPIGMITGDELMYAGAAYSNNTSFYLYSGSSYWTMSPAFSNGAFSPNVPNVLMLYNYDYYGYYGYIAENMNANISSGVRPVINLKSTTQFTGTGTSSNPYRVV